MHSRRSAFTIVELLIIISTVGILATIGIVSYGGLTTQSQNRTRESELNMWKSTFNLYKSRFASYPAPSTVGTFCVGTDLPNNKCGDKNGLSFNPDASFNTQLSRVTKLPTADHPYVYNRYVGPYVVYTLTDLTLVGVFQGGASSCPRGTTYDATSPANVAYCKITLAY